MLPRSRSRGSGHTVGAGRGDDPAAGAAHGANRPTTPGLCEEPGVDSCRVLVNLQPAGEYLGEDYYRAGGVPAVVSQLMGEG